jgi:HK97 family phage portal protein
VSWLSSLRETRSAENPAVPLTSQTLVDMLIGPTGDSGVTVTQKTALGMPAVYRAIALLSGTVGSLPLHTYRDRGADVRERMRPAPKIITTPHPDLTQFEWMELSLAHALSWGNTYYRKLRDGQGIVRELWPLEPCRVKAGRAADGHKIYAVDERGMFGHPLNSVPAEQAIEEWQPYTDDGILHVPGMGYDGVVGLSPIGVARQAIGLGLAAEKFGAKLFGSGSMPTGILTTEQRLDTPQADALKARWKQQHGGLDKAHDIAVLGQGTTFQPISVPPEDAQFIESRRFQISEIARMYGVPPHMLMDTEKSTSWGTGIEQQGIGFVVYTLRPWLARFEQRLSRLLPAPQFVEFAVEGLLRGDSAQRAAFYTAMWNIGVYSTNDIRRLENERPVDGGDVRYRPLNMGELGQPDPDQQEPGADPSNQPAQTDYQLARTEEQGSAGR